MKILCVNRFSTLDRTGGTYRYVDDLSHELAQRGHEVHLLCKKEHAMDGRDTHKISDGYYIHQFGAPRRNPLQNTWFYMNKVREIAEALDRQIHFDIIFLHDAQFGYLLKKSSLGRRIPLLYFFYAPAYYEFAYKQRFSRARQPIHQHIPDWVKSKTLEVIQWVVEDHLLVQADHILALSQFSVTQLNQFFTINTTKKVSIIPSGVDTTRFSPGEDRTKARQCLGLPKTNTLLFTVRNLMPRMGLENLVLAFSIVKDQFVKEKLLLYIGGKGPLREELVELIGDLNLNDYIKLLGYIPDDDLPYYYKSADFFVLPTVALEGFGIVTIEALATNTPVIGTPIGATPEILKRVGGFLANSASPEDLAAEILAVLEKKEQILPNWKSSEIIESNYSWPIVADQIEKLSFRLIEEKAQI